MTVIYVLTDKGEKSRLRNTIPGSVLTEIRKSQPIKEPSLVENIQHLNPHLSEKRISEAVRWLQGAKYIRTL